MVTACPRCDLAFASERQGDRVFRFSTSWSLWLWQRVCNRRTMIRRETKPRRNTHTPGRGHEDGYHS